MELTATQSKVLGVATGRAFLAARRAKAQGEDPQLAYRTELEDRLAQSAAFEGVPMTEISDLALERSYRTVV